MILGKSISHVNQGAGLFYSKDELRGYYNDLTKKVLNRDDVLNGVPSSVVDSGERIYFSIEIFQYGLGAYDLYLQRGSDTYLQKTFACADWAIANQENNGGWKTFAHENKEYPYSAMAQGEAVSLLLRAYKACQNEAYLKSAQKAVEFMLTPVENGGVTKYDGEKVFLMEYLYLPLVLNGWVFSIWGLFDYCKIIDDAKAKNILDRTLTTLKQKLPDFDTGYWSKYEESKMIASPFYHKLHIAQLKVMYDLTGDAIYKKFAERWDCYQKSFVKSKIAFVKKAVQKIMER